MIPPRHFDTVDELVIAHVADMVASAGDGGNTNQCVNLALTTLLSILATGHGGDREKIGEDFAEIARYVARGLDNGGLRFEAYS